MKFLCSTSWTCACHEHIWESGAVTPLILILSIVWRWVVSFMSHMFYFWVKSPWYPSNRRLDEHQNQSGHFREEKNLLRILGIVQWFLVCPALCLVAILSMLSWLPQWCGTSVSFIYIHSFVHPLIHSFIHLHTHPHAHMLTRLWYLSEIPIM